MNTGIHPEQEHLLVMIVLWFHYPMSPTTIITAMRTAGHAARSLGDMSMTDLRDRITVPAGLWLLLDSARLHWLVATQMLQTMRIIDRADAVIDAASPSETMTLLNPRPGITQRVVPPTRSEASSFIWSLQMPSIGVGIREDIPAVAQAVTRRSTQMTRTSTSTDVNLLRHHIGADTAAPIPAVPKIIQADVPLETGRTIALVQGEHPKMDARWSREALPQLTIGRRCANRSR